MKNKSDIRFLHNAICRLLITGKLVLVIGHAMTQTTVDSLINIVETGKDTHAVLACHQLANILAPRDLDSTYQYLSLGIKLTEELNYRKGKLLLWRAIGGIEARRGNYEESKAWTHRGLKMIEEESLPIINRVDYLINLGVADYFKGNIGKALEPHIEAVEICRANGFDDKRAKLLNNIGIFYRQLKRYDEAIRIYEEGVALRQQLKDTAGVANIYFNMAAAYSYLEDYDNALATAGKSRSFYEYLDSKPDLLLCELSMGTALQKLGRLEEAKAYFTKLDQMSDLQLAPYHTCLLALSLAELHIDESNFRAADEQLEKIRKILFDADYKDYQIKWFELKAEAMEGQGNIAATNKFLHEFIEASESKNEEESAAFRKEMETKYLSQEKDHEIALLNADREVAEANLQIARQRNLGLLLGLIGLIMLAGLLIYFYRRISKQKEALSKADAEKSTLLKEIHHRVKNNLQVISALLELQSKYLQDDGAKAALLSGQSRVSSMALIHRDLYQHDNLKGVNSKEYFDKLIDNITDTYLTGDQHIKISSEIQELYLDVDTMVPLGLVTNELIANALKHAFTAQQNGEIIVRLREGDDRLYLSVEDNGSGVIDLQSMKNKSFGFSLVESFAKKLQADLSVESGNGLKVSMVIQAYQKASTAA